MRTPATAVLWESWRLSRRKLAVLMFMSTLGGAALIISPLDGDWGATLVLVLVVFLGMAAQVWTQNVDSRKGFALRLGFTRPIRTWVLVSVPMVYVAISSAAVYLVPMIALRAAFDIPFPLLPVAAFVSTVNVALVGWYWPTGNPGRRAVFAAVVWLFWSSWYLGRTGLNGLANNLAPDRWQTIFSFSPTAYGWMLFIFAVAFGVTIVGVARQRRGDDDVALPQPPAERADALKRPTLTRWIADRLGVRCPVTSPTRAQLWFEMYTVGGRILTSGALVALAGPLFLTALTASGARGENLMGLAIWGPVVPLIAALPSMLGVRRKQGNTYLSAFAATRALGTARLVGLKVLVTSLTLFVAWVAIGTSLWVFAVPLAAWGPETQATFVDYYPSLPVTAAALPIIVSLVVYATAAIAGAATLHAFLILNGRRVVLVGLALSLYIASWVLAGVRGWVDPNAIGTVHVWIVTGTMLLATAYLLRRLIAERIFTSRGLVLVAGIWVGFALMALWVHLEPNDDFVDRVAWFVIAVLPLTAAALAPWSFSRLRHQ